MFQLRGCSHVVRMHGDDKQNFRASAVGWLRCPTSIPQEAAGLADAGTLKPRQEVRGGQVNHPFYLLWQIPSGPKRRQAVPPPPPPFRGGPSRYGSTPRGRARISPVVDMFPYCYRYTQQGHSGVSRGPPFVFRLPSGSIVPVTVAALPALPPLPCLSSALHYGFGSDRFAAFLPSRARGA